MFLNRASRGFCVGRTVLQVKATRKASGMRVRSDLILGTAL